MLSNALLMSRSTGAVSCFLSMASRITSVKTVVCMMDISGEFHFLLAYCLGVKRRLAVK